MDPAAWLAHARGRAIPAAVLAYALLLGCGAEEEQSGDAPRSAASGPTSPAHTPSIAQSSEDPGDRDCVRSQRRLIESMEWPLIQVVWLVTSDLDGHSAEASEKASSTMERAVAKVSRSCAPLPVEMATLRSELRAATAAPLDARRLGDLEDGFERWARAIGNRESPLEGATATLRHCKGFAKQVRAGYEVWWDYIPEGKRWWVQMVVENDTDKRYLLDLSGTMRVTGQVWPNQGGRRSGWGGSSADSMYATPGSTSTKRVGLTEYLHTTAKGEVYDVHPEVFIYHQAHSCSLPVPRLN